MNIWLIQTGEILPLKEDAQKMRIALLAEQLAERGHSVVWWTSAFSHVNKEWLFQTDTLMDLKPGIKILALKGLGYKKNISLARFIDHRLVARKFKKHAAKMPMPDLVLTSTPPYDLAYAVVSFAKSHNIPVIVDIRDEWPDFFLTLVPAKFRNIFKILLVREFRMVAKALEKADALTAMITPLLEWGLKYAGRPKTSRDRVFYLGHKKTLYNKNEERCNLLERIQDKFVVTFLGTITKNNNPTILIDVAERLREEKQIIFVIAGDGELFAELKERVNSQSNVIMTGWLSPKKMDCLLRNSHVGICSTPKWRDAFPNKAFAYLSAGLPLVMPFRGDLKELAEKYRFGFHYNPTDVNSLSDYIKRLAENKLLHKTMSDNAKRIFDDLFDAKKVYLNFAIHIESLADSIRTKNLTK
ncbi:MAG: glycosyltransferase family 4 protein [Smithellaceae bacterium]